MLHNEILQLAGIEIQPGLLQYEWRPARLEDAAAIHELLLAVEAVDQNGWVDTMEDRQRDFEDPASNYKTDTILAVTPYGQIAASGWIFAPPVADQEYIAYLWLEVHPVHRGLGLEDAVLSWLERRGSQILASRPAGPARYLRSGCADHLRDRLALYETHAFQPVRSAYRMRRDLHGPIPEVRLPEDIRLEHWTPELDRLILETCNEAFRDHWGFIPWNEEVWKLWYSGHPNFRPDLTFLALHEDENYENPVAGLSLNQVRSEENKHSGLKEAWIQELCVRRPWRRQGIATALLCASMRAFKQAGFDYAGLGVDTENLTGALRVYERLGFQVVRRFVTYSKIPQ